MKIHIVLFQVIVILPIILVLLISIILLLATIIVEIIEFKTWMIILIKVQILVKIEILLVFLIKLSPLHVQIIPLKSVIIATVITILIEPFALILPMLLVINLMGQIYIIVICNRHVILAIGPAISAASIIGPSLVVLARF